MSPRLWDRKGRRLSALGRPIVTSIVRKKAKSKPLPPSLSELRHQLEEEETDLQEWLKQNAPRVDVDSAVNDYMERSTSLRDEILRVVLSAHAAADAITGVNRVLSESLNMDESRVDMQAVQKFLTIIIRAKMFQILTSSMDVTEEDARQMQNLFLSQLIPTGPRARPQPQQPRQRDPGISEILDTIQRMAPGPERTR